MCYYNTGRRQNASCFYFSVKDDFDMKTEMYLTVGKVPTTLLRFAFPLFIANLLQSLYNIVDMLVVGQIVGSTGVAAISNASTLVFIVNAICLGVTTGGTVLIAQYKGAGNKQGQKDAIGTIYALTGVLAIIITIAGLATYRHVFSLMNVPIESLKDARDYMLVILCGTIFVFGYNATCSILRGIGDSIRPLIFVGIATVINVILDCIFVGLLNMGTVGAAYATVISQGMSFVISVAYLKRQNFLFDFKVRSFAVHPPIAKSVLKISLPTAIQMAVVNLSYLIIAAMLNMYGVTIAAASGIGLKINTFAGMPCWAIGSAMTAMVGQNMGAGQIDRTKKIGTTGLKINLLVTLISVVFVQLFAGRLVMLFDTSDPAVISAGIEYLRICCFWNSLIYAIMYSFDSFAVGVGAALLAMVDALLDSFFIRLPLCSALSSFTMLGFKGVYWGQALSPIIPALIGSAYYLFGNWKTKKLVDSDIA